MALKFATAPRYTFVFIEQVLQIIGRRGSLSLKVHYCWDVRKPYGSGYTSPISPLTSMEPSVRFMDQYYAFTEPEGLPDLPKSSTAQLLS